MNLIKILPAEFLAGNFFIVILWHSYTYLIYIYSFFSSRQASLLFF